MNNKSTATFTIGVPVELYATLSNTEIKEKLMLSFVCNSDENLSTYTGKKVNLVIRLNDKIAKRIKNYSDMNDLSIVQYTANLLGVYYE